MRRDVRIRRFDVLGLFSHFLRIMTGLALIDTWIRDGILFAVAHFAGDAAACAFRANVHANANKSAAFFIGDFLLMFRALGVVIPSLDQQSF
mgnify:CR=1 FL=1